VFDRFSSAIAGRWRFEWRYWRNKTPWDTNITPPEVLEFLDRASPGRALDLGCGTGTNAITLARRGWRVTGVDFAPKAIRAARRKAAAAGEAIRSRCDFHCADVSDLAMLRDPFDYVLDIGCLFTLSAGARRRYADGLARLLRPGGCYMLYAWCHRLRGGRAVGLAPGDVERLLQSALTRTRLVIGEERGKPFAWYWYTKR